MAISRTSNGHDGDWHQRGPAARDWAGRPLILAGLLVGLGLLWSTVTGRSRRVARLKAHTTFEPRRDHERRDVSVGWIFSVVLFLGVCGIGIHFILAGFLNQLNKTRAPGDAWQPLRSRVIQTMPQAVYPVLQVSPPRDLEKFRAEEEQQLNTYGWVNQSSGVVHIPIRAAMDLLLKKGLAVRQTAGKAQAGPSSLDLMHERVQGEAGNSGGEP